MPTSTPLRLLTAASVLAVAAGFTSYHAASRAKRRRAAAAAATAAARSELVVERRTTTDGGWKAEAISVGPRQLAAGGNLVVVIVPGNPGIAAFYEEFAKQVVERSALRVRCVVLGYLGFQVAPGKGGATLAEQVASCAARTEDLVKAAGDGCRFLLVGHSIGCHLCVEACKTSPTVRAACDGVFAMQPFVRLNAESRFQAVLGRVVRAKAAREAVVAVAAVASAVLRPGLGRDAAVARFGNIAAPHAREVAGRYFPNPHIVRAVVELAADEFASLAGKPPAAEIFDAAHSAVAVAVGKDDHWAPESMYKELRDATPSPGGALLTRFYPGLKHDFVTTDDGTATMAEAVAGFAVGLLAPAAAAAVAGRGQV